MPRFASGLYCLIAFIGLLIGSKAFASDLLELKQQAWFSADISNRDRLIALTKKPAECINPDAPSLSVVGRLAFESPALLGGQAARMGLSCDSCHLSGRTNPHFFLNNISSVPGTADVTHSFFSSIGGNNTLSAVMIPDLAKPNQSKIKNRWSDEFRDKLVDLVAIEFDGQRPPALLIDALQTYLANIDIQYCQQDSEQLRPISLLDDWNLLQKNITALINYDDKEVNQLLILIARKRLEKIYLRYANLRSQQINQGLISVSHRFKTLSLNGIEHKNQVDQLSRLTANTNKLFTLLQSNESKSMYNSAVIEALINELN